MQCKAMELRVSWEVFLSLKRGHSLLWILSCGDVICDSRLVSMRGSQENYRAADLKF